MKLNLNLQSKPKPKPKHISLFLLAVVLWIAGMSDKGHAQDYTITVSAGGFDREQTVVSFLFPGEIEAGIYLMESESGNRVTVQVDEHRNGTFVLEELEAGSSRSYDMAAKSVSSPVATSSTDNGISYSVNARTITFDAGGDTVLSYYHGENNPPRELDE
ncbi:MAG TPA: hypothetical protein VK074_01965, partial [Fodinibius sp.]|nr:hypothetical protein [Fodinibius sp.]